MIDYVIVFFRKAMFKNNMTLLFTDDCVSKIYAKILFSLGIELLRILHII